MGENTKKIGTKCVQFLTFPHPTVSLLQPDWDKWKWWHVWNSIALVFLLTVMDVERSGLSKSQIHHNSTVMILTRTRCWTDSKKQSKQRSLYYHNWAEKRECAKNNLNVQFLCGTLKRKFYFKNVWIFVRTCLIIIPYTYEY